MKTIIHFTGDLLVECKNPDDVLHPAIDYLERAALDGCPVLFVHASINDKLRPAQNNSNMKSPAPAAALAATNIPLRLCWPAVRKTAAG